MDSPARGFLMVLTQPSAVMEDEFNAWYDTEHLPERMTVPGFLTGLRFAAVGGGHPRYLAFYDVERPDVLQSDAYNAVSGANFSPWTIRITGRQIVDRRAGKQIWPGDAVLALAPRLRLLRVDAPAGDEVALVAALRGAAETSAGSLSLMVLRAETPDCYYALIRMTYAEPDEAFFPRLGAFGARVSQHVVFAPYSSRTPAA